MKKIILSAVLFLSLALVGPLSLQTAYAACPGAGDKGTPLNQVKRGVGATGDDCTGNSVTSFITSVVRILSLIVGIAAIIVVILSGFKYITSAGDAAKVTSAKNTLIYALVGVAVAALAQFLVHFVFTEATSTNITNPCGPGQHRNAKNVCVNDKN